MGKTLKRIQDVVSLVKKKHALILLSVLSGVHHLIGFVGVPLAFVEVVTVMTEKRLSAFRGAFAVLAVLLICNAIVLRLRAYLSKHITYQMALTLEMHGLSKLQAFKTWGDMEKGAYLSVIKNLASTICGTVVRLCEDGVAIGVMLTVGTGVVFKISPLAVVTSYILTFFLIALNRKNVSGIPKLEEAQNQSMDDMNSMIVHLVNNHEITRFLNRFKLSHYFLEKSEAITSKMVALRRKTYRADQIKRYGNLVVVIAVLLVSALQYNRFDGHQIASIVSLLLIVPKVTEQLFKLPDFLVSLNTTAGKIDRYFTVVNGAAYVGGETPLDAFESICFSEVKLPFEGCDFKIDLAIQKGEVIGLTGASGVGKSAIVKALLGISPYEGAILINGIGLEAYDRKQLWQSVGYIGNQVTVYSTTVRHNVVLGRVDVEDIEVLEALKAVGLDAFATEEGLGRAVTKADFSTGQLKRLAFARALIGARGLYLLDEPLASIDEASYKPLIDLLMCKVRKEEGTVIWISHKKTLSEYADRVYEITRGSYERLS
ncbi:ATP-binding cassette domain-containing protein [Fusibacter sp. JL298sf-3]